jgi:hypothetical protein
MIVLVYSNVALAGVHTYARSFQNNHAYRGIKGGFKIPSIDAKWANNNSSFITFEMWITVNAAPD